MRKTVPTIAALVAFTGAGIGTAATMSTAQAADSSCTTTVPADRTAVTLTNADGGTDLGAGWAAKIGVNLTNLDGCAPGAKVVVGMPKEVALGQVGKVVEIRDREGTGNLIANATIGTDSVTIVLTDYASTHQNVSARFNAWASASEALNTTDDVTLTWTVNGEVHSTVVKGQPSVGVPKGQMPDELGKGGSYSDDTGLIRIGLRTPINHSGSPFTLTDTLTTGGQAIDCGALNISGEQFSAVDSDGDATDMEDMDVKVSDCDAGGVSFTVNPKKEHAGHVYFDVKVTEPGAGVWKDTVQGFQDGVLIGTSSARVIDYGASGGGSGEGIPLPPTDEPTTPPATDTPSETPTTPPTDEPTTPPATDTPSETPTTPPTDEPTTPTDTPTTDAPAEPSTPTDTPTTDTPTTPPTDEPTTPTDTPTTDAPAEPSTPTDTPTTDTPTTPPTDEPTTPTDTPTTTEPTKPSTDKPSEPAKPTQPTAPATGTPTKPSTPAKTTTDKPSTPAAKTPAKTTNPAPSKTDAPTTGPKIQTDHIDRKSPYGVVLILGALLAAAAALGTLVGIKLRKTGK